LIFKSGVVIPAGAVLVVPAQLLQMDDSSWGSDASKFNPYRFLSKAGKDSDLVQDTSFTGVTSIYFQIITPNIKEFHIPQFKYSCNIFDYHCSLISEVFC
jgi:subtilisin family serine protease